MVFLMVLHNKQLICGYLMSVYLRLAQHGLRLLCSTTTSNALCNANRRQTVAKMKMEQRLTYWSTEDMCGELDCKFHPMKANTRMYTTPNILILWRNDSTICALVSNQLQCAYTLQSPVSDIK